jgi:hypothetical protein
VGLPAGHAGPGVEVGGPDPAGQAEHPDAVAQRGVTGDRRDHRAADRAAQDRAAPPVLRQGAHAQRDDQHQGRGGGQFAAGQGERAEPGQGRDGGRGDHARGDVRAVQYPVRAPGGVDGWRQEEQDRTGQHQRGHPGVGGGVRGAERGRGHRHRAQPTTHRQRHADLAVGDLVQGRPAERGADRQVTGDEDGRGRFGDRGHAGGDGAGQGERGSAGGPPAEDLGRPGGGEPGGHHDEQTGQRERGEDQGGQPGPGQRRASADQTDQPSRGGVRDREPFGARRQPGGADRHRHRH